MTAPFRLTNLRIQGVRTIESMDLHLNPVDADAASGSPSSGSSSGLNVLIGENGTGKSTVLECLEILRRTRWGNFYGDYLGIHGGPRGLLRHGMRRIKLGCRFSRPATGWVEWVDYEIELSGDRIVKEQVEASPAPGQEAPVLLLARDDQNVRFLVGRSSHEAGMGSTESRIGVQSTAISQVGSPWADPSLIALQAALESIQVQVPFDVTAAWVAAAHGLRPGVRGAVMVAPAETVERLGANLANVYQSLRNDLSSVEWQSTMDWIRLGLGDWVESVNVRADGAGGSVGLWVKHAGLDLQIPARNLSDGQLQFLGLVALCRHATRASVVAIDEPESHLHPSLQGRVTQFLMRLAETTPVLLATHSRRVLDTLGAAAPACVRICRNEGSPAATTLDSLSTERFQDWMQEYDGLGDALDAGMERLLVREGNEESGA